MPKSGQNTQPTLAPTDSSTKLETTKPQANHNNNKHCGFRATNQATNRAPHHATKQGTKQATQVNRNVNRGRTEDAQRMDLEATLFSELEDHPSAWRSASDHSIPHRTIDCGQKTSRRPEHPRFQRKDKICICVSDCNEIVMRMS
jgi:hypothetical protein